MPVPEAPPGPLWEPKGPTVSKSAAKAILTRCAFATSRGIMRVPTGRPSSRKAFAADSDITGDSAAQNRPCQRTRTMTAVTTGAQGAQVASVTTRWGLTLPDRQRAGHCNRPTRPAEPDPHGPAVPFAEVSAPAEPDPHGPASCRGSRPRMRSPGPAPVSPATADSAPAPWERAAVPTRMSAVEPLRR